MVEVQMVESDRRADSGLDLRPGLGRRSKTGAPALRKLLLLVHIISSLGWLGAIAAYVGLTADLLTNDNPQAVGQIYLAMQLIVWSVILPLAVTTLLTGILQGLVTPWGLLRYYWVGAKLLLNVFAVIVLLDYTQELRYFGAAAGQAVLSSTELDNLRGSNHLVHAIGGMVVLIVASALAVYKPWGLTRYGLRARQRGQQQRQDSRAAVA